MATRFDSVHARNTVLHRAATCTCDKQTACVLGLCAARHLSLSVSCDSNSRSISTSNWHTDVLPRARMVFPQLSSINIVIVDELAESCLCGFVLAFDRLAQSPAFNLNAYYLNCTSEVSCSLLFKFVTNLFEP